MEPKLNDIRTPGGLANPGGAPSSGRFILALLATGLALFAASCRRNDRPAQLPPPIVQVAQVVVTNVPVTVEFIGQLDSPQNVEVRARVEGFVDKMLFTEGAEVNQGDPLFQLDQKPFLEQLAAAEAALAEARAALNKYEKDVARLRPLAEKRAIPQQDLDNAVASVDVGLANVASAEAGLQSARLDLGYCDVRAPISGLIGAKQVAIGDLVGKGQPTLLATISQLDPIWFYCSVSEVQYLTTQREVQGTGRQVEDIPVTLILADGSEHPQTGRWVFRDRAVDAATGTLRVRAEFANPNQVLRPGMFARVRMNLKIERDSILIPQRAVQELQGKNFVWLVDAGNKAAQRPVQVGARVGSDWIIKEGLAASERIIVEGAQKAREGQPVQPMTAAQMAALAAQAGAAQKPARE